jgi:hypothetical protein
MCAGWAVRCASGRCGGGGSETEAQEGAVQAQRCGIGCDRTVRAAARLYGPRPGLLLNSRPRTVRPGGCKWYCRDW